MSTLAVNLRAARTKSKLSLSRLATEAGCTKSYLCALEGGKQSNPSVGVLGRIARALNTSIDELLTEGDEPASFAMPDRIAIDAAGYGWRVWDDEDLWSMVPQNPDNSPIPQPVKWFVPAASVPAVGPGEVMDQGDRRCENCRHPAKEHTGRLNRCNHADGRGLCHCRILRLVPDAPQGSE